MATTQNFSWPSSADVTVSNIGNPTGQPVPADAVYMGAEDPSLNLRGLQVDASGNLKVILQAQPLSPIVTSDEADGPVSPGAVASKSILIGAQFNSALPTLTTGQQAALQVDSNSRLILAPLTNSSIVKAQLQDNAGTAITVGQKLMASSVPVVIASDQSAIPASQSGTWNINNISGTVSLPTGAATEASLAKLPIAQGAALGTNSGPMVQGSVSSAAPAYTSGNINPLSLTPAGALRVDASATTQPVSGTVTANQGGAPWSDNISQFGGVAVSLGQKAMASSMPVAISSDQSAITANQGSANATPWNENLAQVGGSAVSLGQKASASSMPVVLASDQSSVTTSPNSSKGRSSANAPVYTSYSSNNVTSAIYIQLVASTSNAVNLVEIFDSSGQALYFATGASGSEVIQFIIYPGGNGQVPINIPAGTRIAIKAVNSTANSGVGIINLYS